MIQETVVYYEIVLFKKGQTLRPNALMTIQTRTTNKLQTNLLLHIFGLELIKQ